MSYLPPIIHVNGRPFQLLNGVYYPLESDCR